MLDLEFDFGYVLFVRIQQLTFIDHRRRTGRGGPRKGAGRKPARRPIIHHVRRDRCKKELPALVTLRVESGIPSLRKRNFIGAIRETLAGVRNDAGFRVVHYSIQRDHLHLVVEADGHEALGNGMKSVGSRIARAVNRTFARMGKVMAGRYHVRWLRSPRQVRNALQYVLLNVRKHYRQQQGAAPPIRMDEASSGRWFDGWKYRPPGGETNAPRETAPARTWLLRDGWRCHGMIDPGAVPAFTAG